MMSTRRILVLNPKGGCGKTTLAVNIASFYANQGKSVVLADFDPQGSAMEWIAARPETYPTIKRIPAWKGNVHLPRDIDYVVMDAPAAVHGREISNLLKRAESAVIPVLPSPIDIRAAAHFIQDILLNKRVSHKNTKLAVVANRVRENTIVYQKLQRFLKRLDIPFVAVFRDTQNYIRAADRGISIFEMAPSMVAQDLDQWRSLTRWLNSKRSLPG
jgi:chromosome partitioning protein